MALPRFEPPPNTPLLPDPQRDSVWRRWFETLSTRVFPLGDGTVTSVALTAPTEFSVAGSPITTAGTLAVTKATQSANTVWAGPTTGAAAQPAFRALVAADIAGLTSSELKIIYNNENLDIATNTQILGFVSLVFTGTGNLIIAGTGQLRIL